jgi:class 3 adenylate cyclase
MQELEQYRGRIANGTSNGIAAVFDGPARAIRYADALSDALTARGAVVGSGVQTGELEIEATEVTGPALEVAQRLAKSAGPGQILVTNMVRDLVAGSGIRFERASLSNPGISIEVAENLLVDRDSLA